MRAPDSEYDPRRWHAQESRRRPRRKLTRWTLLAGLGFVAATPFLDLARPGINIAPFCMLAIVGSTLSPFTGEAFLVGKGFAAFDEFEQHALLMAMRRAYLVVLALVAAVFGWLALGDRLGWPIPHRPHQWFTLGGAMLIVTAALPVLIAEWTVPFPDPEDQPL